jgi:hypothetical protein
VINRIRNTQREQILFDFGVCLIIVNRSCSPSMSIATGDTHIHHHHSHPIIHHTHIALLMLLPHPFFLIILLVLPLLATTVTSTTTTHSHCLTPTTDLNPARYEAVLQIMDAVRATAPNLQIPGSKSELHVKTGAPQTRYVFGIRGNHGFICLGGGKKCQICECKFVLRVTAAYWGHP